MAKKETDKKNTFARNITIGVVAGTVVTLFKKENREKLVGKAREAKEKIWNLREQAVPMKERVKETVQDIRAKGSQLTDKAVVNEKIESIKKITPLVIETLQESRDIFNKKKQELKEKEDAKRKEEELLAAQAEASATTDQEVLTEGETKPEEGQVVEALVEGTEQVHGTIALEKKEEAGGDKK
ncbi:hypothetical protein [Ectobacillus sp. sgz5001026]|uniref:hypothetical protein n=1 Tax=Ectobacillus sp. sgz5001026 TaxID=3242473 RepID=UPI0036D2BC74